MRLTKLTDYSLRVLMFVATAPEGHANIADIAKKYRISEHHLVKVVHLLGKAGMLVTTRGRGGGVRLAHPPESIPIGKLVRLTEEPSVLVECFSPAGRCAISPGCRLAGVIEQAHKAFYDVLDGYTLADLVQGAHRVKRILHSIHPQTGIVQQ